MSQANHGIVPSMTMFTAEYLNRTNHGYYQGQRLFYLNSNQNSKRYDQISVNPIDRYTWSAAARGAEGECYGILALHDHSDPSNGSTLYAQFGKTRECRGAMATPQSVTNSNSDQWTGG